MQPRALLPPRRHPYRRRPLIRGVCSSDLHRDSWGPGKSPQLSDRSRGLFSLTWRSDHGGLGSLRLGSLLGRDKRGSVRPETVAAGGNRTNPRGGNGVSHRALQPARVKSPRAVSDQRDRAAPGVQVAPTAAAASPRITATGRFDSDRMLRETLPRSRLVRVPWPREPTTIKSASCESAHATISSAGSQRGAPSSP